MELNSEDSGRSGKGAKNSSGQLLLGSVVLDPYSISHLGAFRQR